VVNRGNEPIPPPVHRLDEAGRLHVVAQRLPDLAQVRLEHRLAHMHPCPQGVEEVVLGDQTLRPLEEVAQDGKRLGLERDEMPSPPELLVGGVEAERGEGNHRVFLAAAVYRTLTACS
jgi:hypothetical protein